MIILLPVWLQCLLNSVFLLYDRSLCPNTFMMCVRAKDSPLACWTAPPSRKQNHNNSLKSSIGGATGDILPSTKSLLPSLKQIKVPLWAGGESNFSMHTEQREQKQSWVHKDQKGDVQEFKEIKWSKIDKRLWSLNNTTSVVPERLPRSNSKNIWETMLSFVHNRLQ